MHRNKQIKFENVKVGMTVYMEYQGAISEVSITYNQNPPTS